mmetsp:Transcript_42125/g.111809  ORF Transcript_42125/g.111809 Transcript_42125/m.111809 type:complete len:240 (-) Transcript_42125:172-891(-)
MSTSLAILSMSAGSVADCMREVSASNSKSARVLKSSLKAFRPTSGDQAPIACPDARICAARAFICSWFSSTACLVCSTLPCSRSSIFCTDSSSFCGFCASIALGLRKPFRVTSATLFCWLIVMPMLWPGPMPAAELAMLVELSAAGAVGAAGGGLWDICEVPARKRSFSARSLATSASRLLVASDAFGAWSDCSACAGGAGAGCSSYAGGCAGGSGGACAALSASRARASLSKAGPVGI